MPLSETSTTLISIRTPTYDTVWCGMTIAPALRQLYKIASSMRRRFFTSSKNPDDYAMVDKPYGMVYAHAQSTLRMDWEERMARTSKHDWLEAGLQILAEQGAPGLTIDRLTLVLGLTKGSFYHHFQSLAGYRAALLGFIERKIAEQMAAAAQAPSPAAGIAQLFDPLAAPSLEVALRAWAWQDDEVRAVQARIDDRRVQRAQSFCRQIAEDDEQAVLMSRLAQALMIGSTQVQPPLGPDLRRALFAEFVRLYHFDEAPSHA